MGKPILCLDFDGVVHSYTSGWKGATVITDAPVPGVFDFIRKALQYFDVQIYSSRSHQPGGVNAMQIWLLQESDDGLLVEAIGFSDCKPSAMVTIDDRALTFDGTWPDIETLRAFKPWNKRPPRKCLVKGCGNYSDGGTMVGDLCAPCHKTLTTGKVHHAGVTFIHDLARAARGIDNKGRRIVDDRPSEGYVEVAKLARVIFDYFNRPEGEDDELQRPRSRPPFSFNADEQDLSIGIDGALDCRELSTWVAERMKG